jgi:hypothetical protein
MKFPLATVMMLASIGSAVAADQYDAVYATDPAVCDRSGEELGEALFELQAAVVAPRVGIWMGELECRFHDVRMNPSTWGTVEEVYATARCDGFSLAFIDTVAITSDSSNINLTWGDQEGTPPAMVEILSMRHGDSTDAERDPESYAGVYTLCEGLTAEDLIP